VVFLDYDGVLTPIVDRPGDGVISDTMWDMPGKIVEELQPKIDWQTPTTSRSPTRAADFVLVLPTEVEQLLLTMAR
jgi:hypothetical protein